MKNDIAAALLYTLNEKPLGRRTLVQQTGISESTVRTHLNKLQQKGWVEFAKAGTSLTPTARRSFSPLLKAIRSIRSLSLEDLDLAPCQYAAQVRGVSITTSPLTLRDRAIQGGASGALLLAFVDELMFFDTQDALAKTYPQSSAALLEAFPNLQREDLLLVAFSGEMNSARRGLWHMIVELMQLQTKEAD